MGWDSGNFTRAGGINRCNDEANTGDKAYKSAPMDTDMNDLVSGINQCLNKDGSNTMTGDLSMGGNALTGVTYIGAVDTSTSTSIDVNKTGASGDLIDLGSNGVTFFNILYTGITTISATAGASDAALTIDADGSGYSLNINHTNSSSGDYLRATDQGATVKARINSAGLITGEGFIADSDISSSYSNLVALTDSGTGTGLLLNKTGASGDIVNFQLNGSPKLRVDNAGLTHISGITTDNVSSTDGTIDILGCSELVVEDLIELNGAQLTLGSLPTSSAGLSAGRVWNDSGTLKIV